MSELTELLVRVEAATGPDRELDAYIWGAANGWDVHEVGDHIIVADKPGEVQMILGWADPGKIARNVSINREEIPRYTASIDTALALVERKLPDHKWGLHQPSDGVYRAHVTLRSLLRPMPNITDLPTAPLAILGSLLKALVAQEEAP